MPDPWQTDVLRDWLGVADHRWASSRCGVSCPRQNGKNGALEIRELYGMVALGERILHTAHEVKTARKAFLRLLEFFENARLYPELAGMVHQTRKANGQEAIVLKNGGSVEFVARSRGSGRGFSVDVLVCDEAQELDEESYAALRPTIAASANPQVILTGTPPQSETMGAVFSRFRANGVEGRDTRLAWAEWSCADDLAQVNLDDRAEWFARNPALGTRLQEQTVADERAEFDPETFARERLGWWKPGGVQGNVFDGAWPALADAGAERGSGQVFAVAVAPDRSWSAVAVAWRRPDGLGQVMLADYRPSTEWVAGRVAELRATWGGQVIASTAARGLVQDASEPNQAEQCRAHVALDDAVRANGVRHGNEAALNVAVRAARWKPYGDTRMLDRKGSLDISPLDAAALAFDGLSADYAVLDSIW